MRWGNFAVEPRSHSLEIKHRPFLACEMRAENRGAAENAVEGVVRTLSGFAKGPITKRVKFHLGNVPEELGEVVLLFLRSDEFHDARQCKWNTAQCAMMPRSTVARLSSSLPCA